MFDISLLLRNLGLGMGGAPGAAPMPAPNPMHPAGLGITGGDPMVQGGGGGLMDKVMTPEFMFGLGQAGGQLAGSPPPGAPAPGVPSEMLNNPEALEFARQLMMLQAQRRR